MLYIPLGPIKSHGKSAFPRTPFLWPRPKLRSRRPIGRSRNAKPRRWVNLCWLLKPCWIGVWWDFSASYNHIYIYIYAYIYAGFWRSKHGHAVDTWWFVVDWLMVGWWLVQGYTIHYIGDYYRLQASVGNPFFRHQHPMEWQRVLTLLNWWFIYPTQEIQYKLY